MGESPRWHDGRLWVCDWGAQQIVTVDENGGAEVVAAGDVGLPFCMLGGSDHRILFVVANEWRGMDNFAAVAQEKTGRIFSVEAPAMPAGWP
jgi:sugar lactone lactonase YvrE